MKKTMISLILGASLAVTPSAFALKAMTDANMKKATGQAGVSIAIDDVTIYQSVGATTYTDSDGIGGATPSAGGITVSGDEQLTTIRAIFNAANNTDDRSGFLATSYYDMMNGTAGTIAAGTRVGTKVDGTTAVGAIQAAPLTIDVTGKVDVLSYGMAFNHRGDALQAFQDVGPSGLDVTFSNDPAVQLASIITIANDGLDPADAITAAAYQAGTLTDDQMAAFDEAKSTYGFAANMADQIANHSGGLDAETSFEAAKATISVAGVVIGLPTIEVRKTGTMKTISVTAAGSANDGDAYIMTKKSDSTLAVLGGTIEICPH